jgi:hypothetical protein
MKKVVFYASCFGCDKRCFIAHQFITWNWMSAYNLEKFDDYPTHDIIHEYPRHSSDSS